MKKLFIIGLLLIGLFLHGQLIDNPKFRLNNPADGQSIRWDFQDRCFRLVTGYTIDENGNLSVAGLTLPNNTYILGIDYAGTGTYGLIKLNIDDNMELGRPLTIQELHIPLASGVKTLVNIDADGSSAGTEHGIKFTANGSDTIFEITIEDNGSGGIQNILNKIYGSMEISKGIKHDGYIIRKAAEVQTIGATQTTIDNITLLDENTYQVKADVIGIKNDGTARASYFIVCTVYRTAAGGATLQGGVTELHGQESVDTDATFTVSGNDLRVSVTGIATETWEWSTTMRYINSSN